MHQRIVQQWDSNPRPQIPQRTRPEPLDLSKSLLHSSAKHFLPPFAPPPPPPPLPPVTSGFLPSPTPSASHFPLLPRSLESSSHLALSTLQRMSELQRLRAAEAAAAATAASRQQWFWRSQTPSSVNQVLPQQPPQSVKSDMANDVFRCVWCQESYSSLAQLTQHLKDTGHSISNKPDKNVKSQPSSNKSPSNSSGAASMAGAKHHDATTAGGVTVPRKLVRGQDVWLGKGQEQTRQILKCMWCGESFGSLAELTTHMQETQHYTKVISQEQLSSWQSGTDQLSSPGDKQVRVSIYVT